MLLGVIILVLAACGQEQASESSDGYPEATVASLMNMCIDGAEGGLEPLVEEELGRPLTDVEMQELATRGCECTLTRLQEEIPLSRLTTATGRLTDEGVEEANAIAVECGYQIGREFAPVELEAAPEPSPAAREVEPVTTAETPTETEVGSAPAPEPEPEPVPEPEPPPEPPEPPVPQAPPPVELQGSGQQVVELTLAADTPLVVAGSHNGGSNFIVELVPRQGANVSDFFIGTLFNEIGTYQGQVAIGEAGSGDYRVDVTADGNWTLRFTQPAPNPRAQEIPASFEEAGSKVKQMRVPENMQPIASARHRGESNFVVQLIPLEDVEEADLFFSGLVFNEIGNFEGETLTDPLGTGTYLAYVLADGNWTLEFTP